MKCFLVRLLFMFNMVLKGSSSNGSDCSEIRADLIIMIDESKSIRSDANPPKCVGVQSVVKAFAKAIVEELSDNISSGGIRIAIVTYGGREHPGDATVVQTFADSDAGTVAELLQTLEDLPLAGRGSASVPGALSAIQDTLLAASSSSSNISTGFRNHAAPVALVVISDGQSRQYDDAASRHTPAEVAAALALPAFKDAKVHVFDPDAHLSTLLKKHQPLDDAVRSAGVQGVVGDLSCGDNGAVEMQAKRFKIAITSEPLPCLTTPTTTPTTSTSVSSTPTTTPTSTTATTTPTTSPTSTVTSTVTATPTTTPSTTPTSTVTTTVTSSGTTTVTTTATSTTATSTPTTTTCYPIADLVLVLDGSTAVLESELGGPANRFNDVTRFASELLKHLGNDVHPNRIRVAAVTFASHARVDFDLFGRQPGKSAPNPKEQFKLSQKESDRDGKATFNWNKHTRQRLLALEPIATQGVLSDISVHKAFVAVREQILTLTAATATLSSDGSGFTTTGFRGGAYPVHIVLITPAIVSSNSHVGDESKWQNLRDELEDQFYSATWLTRWIAKVGSAKEDVEGLTLLSSRWSTVVVVADETSSSSTTTNAVAAASQSIAHQLEAETELCETTTATTTPTTTATTTPCNEIRADLIFMIDDSASASAAASRDGTCSSTSETATKTVQQFASNFIKALGSAVSEDGVRVAAVKYTSAAHVVFGFDSFGYDTRQIQNRLLSMPLGGSTDFGGPAPATLANNAFDCIRTELLKVGSDDTGTPGFRNYAAPVVIVIISDGKTAAPAGDPTALVDAMYNPAFVDRPYNDEVIMLAFDTDAAAHADQDQPLHDAVLRIGGSVTDLGGGRCNNLDAVDKAVQKAADTIAGRLIPCLTTPTTTPTTTTTVTTSITSTPTTSGTTGTTTQTSSPTSTKLTTPTTSATSTPTTTPTSSPSTTATSSPTTTETTTPSSTGTSTGTTSPTSSATSTATTTITSTPSTTASTTPTSSATTSPSSTASTTVTSSATTSPSTTVTSTVTTTVSSTPTSSVTSSQSTTATTSATSSQTTSPSTTGTSTVTTSPSTSASTTVTSSQTTSPTSTATTSVSTTVTSTATTSQSTTITSSQTTTVSSSQTTTVSTSPSTTPSSTGTSTATSSPSTTGTSSQTSTPTTSLTSTPTTTTTVTTSPTTTTPTSSATFTEYYATYGCAVTGAGVALLTAASDPRSSCPAQAAALNAVLHACGHARNVVGSALQAEVGCGATADIIDSGGGGNNAVAINDDNGNSNGNINGNGNGNGNNGNGNNGNGRPSLPLVNVGYGGKAKASSCQRTATAVQSAIRQYTTDPAVEGAVIECVGASLVVNPANVCHEVADTISALANDYDARGVQACAMTTMTSTPTTTPTTGTTTTATGTTTFDLNPTVQASNARLEQSTFGDNEADESNSFSVTIIVVCGTIVLFVIIMCGLMMIHRIWEEEARVAPTNGSQGAQTHLTMHRDWFSE